MALTNKQKEAVNACLMAVAKEIPRTLVPEQVLDPTSKDHGEWMVVKVGDVLNEMRKMIQVLKDEG